MAARGQEVRRLVPLSKHQERLLKLKRFKVNIVSKLHVLLNVDLGLGNLAGLVSPLPGEADRARGLIPKDLLDLVRASVVGGYHH